MNEFNGMTGEYLALGVVFVEGDWFIHSGDLQRKILFNCIGIRHANQGFCDDHKVAEFAPRIITGTQPVANNVLVNVSVDGIDWSRNMKAKHVLWDGASQFWRPALIQKCIAKSAVSDDLTETPEEREAFERISKLGHCANTGSTPDLVAALKFLTAINITGPGSGIATNTKVDHGPSGLVVTHEFVFPIKTERDKAIDKMMASIVHWGNRESMMLTMGQLYDAGCRFDNA